VTHKDLRPSDLGKSQEQLIHLDNLMPLSFPYDQPDMERAFPEVKPEWKEKYFTSLDGCVALDTLQRPQTEAEEKELVQKFLRGMEKVFSDANKGVWQPLQLAYDYCAKCDTCSDACHITRLLVIKRFTVLFSERKPSACYIKAI